MSNAIVVIGIVVAFMLGLFVGREKDAEDQLDVWRRRHRRDRQRAEMRDAALAHLKLATELRDLAAKQLAQSESVAGCLRSIAADVAARQAIGLLPTK